MGDYPLRLDEDEVRRYRTMAAMAQAEESADWAAAGIVPGARVADVGCGPGAVLAALAEVVGPAGRAVGVDGDADAVARASTTVADLAQAEARAGRADATGLAPAAFDVAMCRHVLAHNGGREAAIVAHLASLARPGGAVYLVDVDLTGARMRPEPDDTDLDFLDRYVAFHAARGNDVTVGLRLGELLEEVGLVVQRYRCVSSVMRLPPGLRPPAWAAREAMIADGAATEEDVERWLAAYERIDATQPRPWFFMPVFVAVGRRVWG